MIKGVTANNALYRMTKYPCESLGIKKVLFGKRIHRLQDFLQ